jgi:hypothetical protein
VRLRSQLEGFLAQHPKKPLKPARELLEKLG